MVIRDLREIIEAKDAALTAKDLQVAALRATNEAQAEQLVTLAARVEELERQKGRGSGNSGKPPSSDSIYTKKTAARDRSQRERGRRNPGKQPGEPGTTMKLIDNADVRIECPQSGCDGCGAEEVATGWTAAVRGKVAALLAGGGFAEHLRELLRTAPALHVDETLVWGSSPARPQGPVRVRAQAAGVGGHDGRAAV